MAQLLVRRLDQSVKDALRRRAKRHGRSVEDEVRHILRDAARDDRHPPRNLGSRVAARFKTLGLRAELPELRGQLARSAAFEE